MSQFMPKQVSFFKLEDDQGHQCVRQKIHSPVSEYIIASRQIFNTYYPFLEGETPCWFVSTRGNDYLQAKYKKEISWDAVAEYDMNALRFAPLKNEKGEVIGTRLSQVIRYDPKGQLPAIVKSLVAQ